jgi:type IV pilus assembly protein PilE
MPLPHLPMKASSASPQDDIPAFSLTELMVVVVIIGILTLMALPRFDLLTQRAKSVEAQVTLEHIHMLQTSYHMMHDTYSRDLLALGYQPRRSTKDGGSARYEIDIVEASPVGFLARAIATVDYDQDGLFNTWTISEQRDLKEVVAD